MRSRKAGLSEVEKQSESWRSKPHGRLIPEELWNAAVGLLDRYTPSAICRHLRLNSARFKKVRKTHGAVVSAKRCHQSIISGGNLCAFENLAQTLVAVDAS